VRHKDEWRWREDANIVVSTITQRMLVAMRDQPTSFRFPNTGSEREVGSPHSNETSKHGGAAAVVVCCVVG